MRAFTLIIAELRRHRIAVPLFLLAIVAMVILPLPATVLDVLFTFNIVLALIVILVSVTSRRPLDFSVFPTVILASTLMRLTLNVASTRIVLLNGHEGTHAAGRVIEAFGHVAIGSNFVVGIVVFAILTIINFVVVTKGAERISEVSARFTLDALPGKQMAIDADLNSGLINQEKAQTRRREVSSEADFYGAMDGASKFVRGDAVAGILILFINMIGGVAIGSLMHDLSLGDSFRLYALLTIGDGLVAQIPALLLSAAAAIIVTRISDSGHFEDQVRSQMLASPTVLYGAAGMMLVLGIIPGMPWLTFLAFAAVLAFAAWRMSRRAAEGEQDEAQIKAAALTQAEPELEWRSLPFVEALSVSVGYKLASLLDPARGAPLVKRVKGMRQNLSESMGILLPPIPARDDLSLRPTQYAILLSGTAIVQAEVHPDRLMAIAAAQVYGDLDGVPGTDPAYGMPVMWITHEDRANALGLGYQVVDCTSVIATHVSKVAREHLPELFRHEEVPALLERLSAVAPKLAGALEKALTHSQLLKVFRQLLAENVSLKDIIPIATTLVECAESTKEPLLLSAEVRCTLRRQILASLVGQATAVKAFNLGGELENLLLASYNQAGKAPLDNFPVDPRLLSQLQTHMPAVREQMKQNGSPALLLVLPQIRPLLARYARLFAPGLAVLSYNEIPEHRDVSIVGSLG